MGGKPGGSLWEKCNYAVGVEYGYSLPGGPSPESGFRHRRRATGAANTIHTFPKAASSLERDQAASWFGPTKAEVSLVWLLGRGNYNDKKGGGQ